MASLLTAVSAPQAGEVDKMKMELRRLPFDEQVRGRETQDGRLAIERQPEARSSHGARLLRLIPTWPAGDTSRLSSPPTCGRYIWARARTNTETRRILSPHLSHREPEGDADRRGPQLAARVAIRWCTTDQLRRWQDALDACALPSFLRHGADRARGVDAVLQDAEVNNLPPRSAWCSWVTRFLPAIPLPSPMAQWYAPYGGAGLAARWQEGLQTAASRRRKGYESRRRLRELLTSMGRA